LGVPRRKGGSGFPFQTFFAEKAQKGFPLQSLTQIKETTNNHYLKKVWQVAACAYNYPVKNEYQTNKKQNPLASKADLLFLTNEQPTNH